MSDALAPPPRRSAGPAPPRAPASLRRTSTIDVDWPEGRGGNMRLVGRARDVVTRRSGEAPVVLAQDGFEALVRPDRTLVAIAADPPRPALSGLVGARGGGGLRKILDEVVPDERRRATPLYLILDDIAGVSLVSSWAWTRWDPNWLEAARSVFGDAKLEELMQQRIGVCIGLAPGSSAFAPERDRSGAPAAELRRPDDPQGWHDFADQEGVGMRRARRIDIRLDDAIRIDAAFQDSATTPAGGRSAVHEYTLQVAGDPLTLAVTAVQAQPRVLPHAECPSATANLDRLLGVALPDLRETVSVELRKTAGCTHLNDALRALADAPALVERLRATRVAAPEV